MVADGGLSRAGGFISLLEELLLLNFFFQVGMADDFLSRQVERMRLTVEEKEEHIEIDDNEISQCDHNLQLSLACKILTTRFISGEIFKTMIPRIWNVENVKIKGAGRNVFVCKFQNSRDLRRVMNDGLWFFDKGVLSFEEMMANSSIIQMEFRYVSFWVHLRDLPIVGFSRASTKAIGNLIGKCEKVDYDEDGQC